MTNIFPFPPSDAEMVKREFRDFDISTLPASIPDGFTCAAWHNDALPTWLEGDTADEQKAGTLMIGIDYADVTLREYRGEPELTRFSLQMHTHTGDWVWLFDSNDWAAIETMVAYVRYVRDLGLGFHVDTRGRDYIGPGDFGRLYSDDEAAEYDDVIYGAHRCCDPYEVAIKVWQALGLVEE